MPIRRLVHWYHEHERSVSSISLIGGFIFDALTLRQVDAFWENFWVIIHLVVSAVLILLLNRKGSAKLSAERSEFDFWLLNLLQFTFGGLLSAFLVFYFRSSALSVSWPFLLLLALAFVANERLKRHQERLIFQISLFFLSLLSFAVFFIPVLIGSIGPWVFVLSGVASLLCMRLLLRFLPSPKRALWLSVVSIFVAINALYFTHILPPLPISLRDGGIYYSVHRDPSGEYIFTESPQSWLDYFKLYPPVQLTASSETLYAYTAIYSPAKFSTNIYHEWQYYDEAKGKWITESKVLLSTYGGRDQGYRTYSSGRVVPGKWKVNVLTEDGQIIGWVGFTASGV